MKVEHGTVTILRGDNLQGVSILCSKVVLDAAPIQDAQALESVLRSMGCQLGRTTIRDCYIVSLEDEARQLAKAAITVAMLKTPTQPAQPAPKPFWRRALDVFSRLPEA